jgi:hypothetical protein
VGRAPWPFEARSRVGRARPCVQFVHDASKPYSRVRHPIGTVSISTVPSQVDLPVLGPRSNVARDLKRSMIRLRQGGFPGDVEERFES